MRLPTVEVIPASQLRPRNLRNLSKETVPKLTRVAVLYDPAAPGPAREMKEVLPVAARALGLTIQPWELRGADGFEKVFAALSKQRPDGLYLPPGPLTSVNRKRITGLALKSRLPSVYISREFVDAGGLMSYGGRTKPTATGALPIT